MATPCFLIEPTGEVVNRISLAEDGDCPGGGWHRAEVVIDGPTDLSDDGLPWPEVCDACDRRFTDEARRGGSSRRRWRRADDPSVTFDSALDAGPGAMWDAFWMPSAMKRADGQYLVAILPNGHEWHIDGSASNCTRKGEDHDCWCRHGEPPNVTVDKYPEPGRSTCSAGAGSIASDGYHGFLRAGAFT